MGVLKLTPWFGKFTRPVRPGIYERRYKQKILFSKWDGEKWLIGSRNQETAEKMTTKSGFQYLPWRGLASPPEEK